MKKKQKKIDEQKKLEQEIEAEELERNTTFKPDLKKTKKFNENLKGRDDLINFQESWNKQKLNKIQS